MDFVLQTGFDSLPQAVVEATKKDILDTMACGIGGSGAPGAWEVVELVTKWAGESSLLVFGTKVPSPYAALANATMAHALDYDDTYDAGVIHAGVTVVPACLAVAEYIGRVSGQDFLTAVTLGIDIACRLARAITTPMHQQGFIYTSVVGYFGAAAAVGKLLGLDREKLSHALGIAYSLTSGNRQCVPDGALTKRGQAGFAAMGGVIAALMAERGFTGAKNFLEGDFGFFNTYFRGDYNPDYLTQGLGNKFEVVNLSFKPYPCCRLDHPFIEATLELVSQHHIAAEDIEKIILFTGEERHHLCYPLEKKRRPQNVVDAQFSIPYTVANAASKRRVVIKDFFPKALKNQAVLACADKIEPRFDPSLASRAIAGGRVEIVTTSGRYVKQVSIPKGHPDNPMTAEEVWSKLEDCAQNAARPLSSENLRRLTQLIDQLEKQDDMRQLITLLIA